MPKPSLNADNISTLIVNGRPAQDLVRRVKIRDLTPAQRQLIADRLAAARGT